MLIVMLLMLQLLQNIVEMVDECKSVVKSLRQQRQLTTPRSVDSQADVNQKTGLPQFLPRDCSLAKRHSAAVAVCLARCLSHSCIASIRP